MTRSDTDAVEYKSHGWREYGEYDPAVRLFLFVEPVDLLRNQALHDSTLGLQNLEDEREIINPPPLTFLTWIMNMINMITIFLDPCTYWYQRGANI